MTTTTSKRKGGYRPTESKYKGGADEMYVTYDLDQKTRGGGSARYPKIRRGLIAGGGEDWEARRVPDGAGGGRGGEWSETSAGEGPPGGGGGRGGGDPPMRLRRPPWGRRRSASHRLWKSLSAPTTSTSTRAPT